MRNNYLKEVCSLIGNCFTANTNFRAAKTILLGLLFTLFTLAFSSHSNAQIIYSEGFETSIPAGWVNSGFSTSATTPCDGAQSIRTNIYSFNTSGNIKSPNLGTSMGYDIVLDFEYKIIDWSGGGATSGDFGSVYFEYSIDNEISWDTLVVIDSSNHTPSTGCATILDTLTGIAANTPLKVRYSVVFGSDPNLDYYLYFDNFNATEQLPCQTGSIDSARNITSTSAEIFFTESLGNLVNFQYGPAGFALGNGIMINNVSAADDSILITGLFPNLTYDIYIQDSCTGSGSGVFNGPFSFTTTSAGAAPPTIIQDWTAGTTGWTLGNSGPNWQRRNTAPGSSNTGPQGGSISGTPTSGDFYVYLETSTSAGQANLDNNNWVDLTTFGIPMIVFDYHMFGASMGSLELWLDTNNSGFYNAWSISGQQHFSRTDPYTTQSIILSPTVDSVKIRFTGVRGTSFTSDMAVDNIGVGEAPNCPQPTIAVVSNDLTSAIVNVFAVNDSVLTIEYGPQGFVPGTGTTMSAVNGNNTISNLPSESFYDVYVYGYCNGAEAMQLSAVASFNTLSGTTCNTAVSINAIPYLSSDSLSTTGYGNDYSNNVACNYFYMQDEDYVFTYTATITQRAVIEFSNSTPYTSVMVTEGCPDVATNCVMTYSIFNTNSGTSPVVLFEAGKTYYITVDNYSTSYSPNFFTMAINPLPDDFVINSIDNPVNPVSAGFANVDVNVTNLGGNPATSISFGYTKNGVNQAPVTITLNNLAPFDDTTVTIGGTNFPLTPTDITAFVTAVNGAPDNNQNNDTVSTRFCGPIAGTFTVGGTNPDFATLSDAVEALNCGISGPIVFNIAPGTYNEAVSIPQVFGASSTNTITFDGGSASTTTITFNSSLDVPTIDFDGADYVTLRNLTVEATWTSTDNWPIYLRNEANHNTIENCVVTMPNTTTTSDRACIGISSNLFGISTAYTGNNANHLTIRNNTITGGYYGIAFMGSGTSSIIARNTGVTIENNTIDANYSGIYLYGVDSAEIRNNTISTISTLATQYAVWAYYGNGTILESNTITTPDRGLYSVVGENHRYVNNMISANSDYGIYLSSIVNATILHNSVLGERSFFVASSAATGLNVQNNIFASQNSLAFESNSAGAASFNNLDYNLYFSQASPAIEFNNTAYSSLLAWQNAEPTFNGGSVQGDPLFNSTTDLHITSGLLADSAGTPVGVITDIDGEGRYFLAPDLGADEYTPITKNLELLSDVAVGLCKTGSDTLRFAVINKAQILVDFSLDNFTLNVNVTGAANSANSVTINSGTLNFNDTLFIDAAPFTLNSIGTYNIDAYISSTWDVIKENDTISATTEEVTLLTVTPDSTVNVLNGFTTVDIEATTPLGGLVVMFSEICNFQTTSGQPTGGWTTVPYLDPYDDYMELTGSPGADLGGYSIEIWTTSALSRSWVIPTGTVFSPTGVMTMAQGTAVSSPSNFFYEGHPTLSSGSYSSGSANGYIIKDPNGNIVDAAAINSYTFPAASGVTSADWSGTLPSTSGTSGVTRIADDSNSSSDWAASASTPQTPGFLNAGVSPPAGSVPGAYWSLAGALVDSSAKTTVGPWTVAQNGSYTYIYNLPTPCGIVTDSVIINVNITPDEVSVTQIIEPVSGCNIDTTFVEVEVCNNGASTQYNLPVYANIDGIIYTDTLDSLIGYSCTNFVVVNGISTNNSDTAFANITAYVSLMGDVDITNDSSTVSNIMFTGPGQPPVILFNDTVCSNNGSGLLVASATDNVVWYDSLTGGNIIAIGDSIILPNITKNDTLYAQTGGSVSNTSQIGNGTTANSTTTYPAPFGNFYWGSREQQLYTAAELQAAGFTEGFIEELSYFVTNTNGSPALTNFEIKVGFTNASALTNTWETGLTSVYFNSAYTPVTGVNNFVFNTTPYWDGTSNIVIETCFNNSSFTDNASTQWTTGLPFNASHTYRADASGVCANNATTFLSTTRTNATFKINLPSPCFNPNRTMAVVYYNGISIDSTLSVDQSNCLLTDGTINVFASDANPSVGGTLQYSIDGGNTFQASGAFANLANNAFGYDVVVTDGVCTQAGPNIVINKPGAPAAPGMPSNLSYCEGDMLMPLFIDSAGIDSGVTQIKWYTDPTLNPLSQIGVDTIFPIDSATTLTYYATQVLAGCEGAAGSVSVSITPTPIAGVANNDTTACFGQDVFLGATLPFNPTFNGFSGFVPLTLTAQNLNVSITNAPIPSGPATISFTTYGDIDIASSEFYILFDENNNAIGNSINGVQCSFTTTTFTVPQATVAQWAADGVINFVADAQSGVNNLNCNDGVEITITYDAAEVNWYLDNQRTMFFSDKLNEMALDTIGSITYFVEYTDATGCASDLDSMIVTKLASPSAPTVGNQVFCDGDSITALPITGSGGTFNVYSDAGLNNQIATNVNSFTSPLVGAGFGQYYVTEVNNLGCESPANMGSVTINAVPASANLGADRNYCQGDSILPINPSNIPGTTLNWYSDASGTTLITTGSLTPSNTVGTTTYYASLSNGLCSGPIDSVKVTINPIPGAPTAAGGATYCDGDALASLSASGTGNTFSWYADAALTNMIGSGATFTPINVVDTITYYVTQSLNGCESSTADSATVIINSTPSIVSVVSDSASACNTTDGWIEITATGGDGVYSYSVNGGTTTSANDSITGLAPGNYTPFVIDGNGCSDVASVVTINAPGQPLQPSVIAGNNATYCQGDMYTAMEVVDTISGQTFNWYYDASLTTLFATGDSVMPADSVGQFTYYVTALSGGCEGPSATVNVTVNAIPSAPTGGNDLTFCLGQPVGNVNATANSNGTLRWYNSNSLATQVGTGGSFAAGSIAILPGSYNFYVTETVLGCESAYDSVSVTINPIPNTPNAGANLVYCDGDMVMPIAGLGSGGTLTWYSNSALTNVLTVNDTLVPSNLPVGTTSFWLAETNALGCRGTADRVDVVVNPTPMAPSIVNAADYCDYDMVGSLTAQGNGGTYTWYSDYTTSVTGTTVTPPSTIGQYNFMLTETNQFGCESDSGMATVNVFQSPSIDSLTIVDVTGGCADSTGAITVNASGGDANYMYYGNIFGIPTSNGASSTFGNLPAGTYDSLYVVDGNGCISGTAAGSIAAPGQPSALELLSSNAVYCFGDAIADLVAQDTSASTAGVIEWYSDAALNNLIGSGDSISPNPAVGVRTYYALENNVGCKGAATSVTVTVNALPSTPNTSGNVQYCDGEVINDIYAVSAGGTITWYSDASLSTVFATGDTTTPSITAPGQEVLYVVETDANGCTSAIANDILITVDTLPNVTVAALADVCENAGTIQLTGAMPMGGTWAADSGVTSGGILDPLAIGGANTYSVSYTYTDGNGCTSSDTASITVNPEPVVTMAPLTAICIDGSPFAVTGGAPTGGTYSGTGVDSTGTFDPTVAGIGSTSITYTYTDGNNCTSSDATSITVNALPNVNAGVDQTICFGDSVTLAATGGATYTWSNGPSAASQSVSPATTTTYGVVGTDANGCANTDSVTVNVNQLPSVAFTAPNSVCDGAAPFVLSTGTPAGGTYSGTGVSFGLFNPSVGAGSYTLSYTFTDGNNCTNVATATMVVDTLPTVTFATPANVCDGSAAVNLTGGAPAGGTYSGTGVTGGQFDPATAGGPGTYNLSYSFTDGNGCANSVTSTITVDTLPVITWTAFNDVCDNGSPVTLSEASPAGGTYSGTGVSGGQFDPMATSGAGSYAISYSYTDGNGCAATSAQNITVNPSPVVNITASDSVLCNKVTTITLDAGSGVGFVWSFNGVPNGETSQTINVTEAGTYEVEVQNAFGCNGTGSYTISGNPAEPCVSVENLLSNGASVTYYPNPTSGMLNIDITGLEGKDITITVTSMHGQQVFNTFIENAPSNLRDVIDLTDEASGVYFIRLTAGDQSFVERISLR